MIRPGFLRLALPLAVACVLVIFPAWAQPPGAAVASAHPKATAAGIEILRAGGNAFDAAVAVSAALAVVEPQSSGLGGGGFWLLHVASKDRDVMIDGREEAPGAATADMYLDAEGHYVETRSKNGPLAAGIPGEPAALAYIAEHFGRLPLARSLAPAIELAREGFAVGEDYLGMLAWRAETLKDVGGAAAEVFLEDGELPEPGDILKQPALADTLEALAAQGRAGFYSGEVAHALVAGVRAAGGIWQLSDLANYEVVEREPIVFDYRGYTVVSASPPSSGGVVLAEILNVLELVPWRELPDTIRVHAAVEGMRRAYRDRAAYLGDPDAIDMPLKRLTSEVYAAGLRAGIRLDRATPSAALAPVTAGPIAGPDTTHFSIIDQYGNRVAATLSINWPFGSGTMPPGTGVVLNNEMDDFSSKPLTPNAYGLIGTAANAIAPGRRPLSSMSPTFVVGPERTAVLGTPGGSRIITMVLLGILEFTAGGDAADMVAKPRYHHQYLPDEIFFEPAALDAAQKERLRAMGHSLEASGRLYGDMQVVVWDRAAGELHAASDPRGIGAAKVIAVTEPAEK